MEKSQSYNVVPFSAYTKGNRIVMPGSFIPMAMTTILAHEGGHVIDFNNTFKQRMLLKPEDLRNIRIGISDARRRWLQDLLAQNSMPDRSWQPELIEFIWRTLEILSKNNFDPGIINLTIIHNEADFKKKAKKDYPGVTYDGDKTIVDLTTTGYELEVPAYYAQKAVHTLIDRIIDPHKTPNPKPPLPAHALAYETVERLFRLGLFPTPRRINLGWKQRLQAA
jgi:hypothetical protein